jgi:hypothetical protein
MSIEKLISIAGEKYENNNDLTETIAFLIQDLNHELIREIAKKISKQNVINEGNILDDSPRNEILKNKKNTQYLDFPLSDEYKQYCKENITLSRTLNNIIERYRPEYLLSKENSLKKSDLEKIFYNEEDEISSKKLKQKTNYQELYYCYLIDLFLKKGWIDIDLNEPINENPLFEIIAVAGNLTLFERLLDKTKDKDKLLSDLIIQYGNKKIPQDMLEQMIASLLNKDAKVSISLINRAIYSEVPIKIIEMLLEFKSFDHLNMSEQKSEKNKWIPSETRINNGAHIGNNIGNFLGFMLSGGSVNQSNPIGNLFGIAGGIIAGGIDYFTNQKFLSQTPLHFAITNNAAPEIIELLIQKGANLNEIISEEIIFNPTQQRKTLLDIAIEKELTEIIKILKEKDAKTYEEISKKQKDVFLERFKEFEDNLLSSSDDENNNPEKNNKEDSNQENEDKSEEVIIDNMEKNNNEKSENLNSDSDQENNKWGCFLM